MAIVLGLGAKFEPKDPLGLYKGTPGLGGKREEDPVEAAIAAAPTPEKTASIDSGTTAAVPVTDAPKGGDPTAKGLARLAPAEKTAPKGTGGNLVFAHPDQDKLDDGFMSALVDTSKALGRDFTINSGYRSPEHPIEAAKAHPGEHSTGKAGDISMKGMSEPERAQLIAELQTRGVKRFGIYKDTPDMLHVDMKDQTSTGQPWFMYDRTKKKLGEAPAWFQAVAKGEGAPTAIAIDESYTSRDPMGLYRGMANPFEAAKPKPAPAEAAAPAVDPNDLLVDEEMTRLEAAEPGRYKVMDTNAYEVWKADWETKNRSTGLGGDTRRLLLAGVAQLPLVAREIVGSIPKVGPTIVQGLDSIDEWMHGDGVPTEQRLQRDYERQIASLTPETIASRGKEWVTEKQVGDTSYQYTPGPAWSDPRSYFSGLVESVPGTVITMGPSMRLASSSYKSAIAGGATRKQAAASAARTATVAGGITEGLMGGGQSARAVRDQIAQIPRQALEQSEAVQQLVSSGMSIDEAIGAVTDDAATQAFVIAGTATGVFGGLGDRVLAKILAEGVGGGITKRLVIGGARGAVGEGLLEEAPQEAAGQLAQNKAMQTVNPDQNLMEGVANAAAGGLAVGATMGAGFGGVGGAFSRADVGDEPPPPPAGPLSKAMAHGERLAANAAGGTFVVNDPATPDMGAGELHGQTVQLAPSQAGTPVGMRRIVAPDGSERLIGERLLAPETLTAKPAPGAVPEGAPPVGATVQVNADDVEPFMARVESYENGEAVLYDSGSGEIYQVPVSSLQVLAPPMVRDQVKAAVEAKEAPAAKITKDMKAKLGKLGYDNTAIREMDPTTAANIIRADEAPVAIDPNAAELEPVEPIVTDIETEGLPPASELRPASERFPGPPPPGARVIVAAPGVEPFSARVLSYEKDGDSYEVRVAGADGIGKQIAMEHIFVSKLTKKEIDAQDLKRDPPEPREQPKGGNTRTVGKKTVVLPNDLHGRLLDLGRLRRDSQKTLGVSSLDRDGVAPPEQKKLADEFKVTSEALGQIADDYRYRVERAAKESRSDLPTTIPPVNAKRLKQWQSEKAKADTKQIELSRDNEMAANDVDWMPEGATYPDHLDAAAHEAATSPTNDLPEPTPAQKEAGNYKKGHTRLGGLDISIENPAGSERRGTSRSGKAWSVTMKSHYGYIKGTVGKDKDHIDVFVKPGTEDIADASLAGVFVVDQRDPSRGKFDEHKVMLGFATEAEARAAYLENYTKKWTGLGAITETTLDEFKAWLATGDTTKPFADRSQSAEAAETEDDILKRMAERHTIKGFLEMLLLKPRAQVAAVIDRKGRLWEITGTSDQEVNPNAGAHGHLFAEITAANIFPDWPPAKNYPYVHVTRYGSQLGLDASELTPVQTTALQALQSAAQRDGISVIRTEILDELLRTPATRVDAQAEAVDDDVVNVRLTREGPWDFNDTWPMPDADQVRRGDVEGRMTFTLDDDGEFDPIEVSSVLDEAMNELIVHNRDITGDEKKLAEIVAGTAKLRGKNPEAVKKALRASILDSKRGIDNIYGTYADLFGETATQALLAEGKARANREEIMTDPAVEQPRIPKEKREISAKPATNISENIPAATETPEIVGSAEPVKKKPGKTTKAGNAAAVDALFASNKLFTVDKVEAARARLKAKMSQLNSGVDPEVLIDGMTIAGAYIEAGVRSFGDYAARMTADFGTGIRPFLLSFWEGARHFPGLNAKGMTIPEESARLHAEIMALPDDGDAAIMDEPALSAVEPTDDVHAELDAPGARALERASSGEVPGAEEGGQTGRGDLDGGAADVRGSRRAGEQRAPSGRGVGDRVAEVPDTAARNDPAERLDPSAKVDASQSIVTPAADQPVEYALSDSDELGSGGKKTKFRQNVAAIRLLRVIEAEQRPATRDEQAVLAKWVGWGGLREAFAREDGTVNKGWEKEAAELKELLTKEEFAAAESSTRNAHYTAPEIVKGVWSIAARLGFKGGQVLEPSVGAGNFLGVMPAGVRKASHVTGVELDRITGGIAKNLYPKANIKAPMGFEAITIPPGHFDLAIGNPPFGSERLYDPENRHLNKFSIHNFFFAKSIDALRPGGVLAMVVTNYFMDAGDSAARAYIAKQADLVGAIRLPNNAFQKNAGTEVTTDIVILRKRLPEETGEHQTWVESGEFTDAEGRTVPLNPYFRKNPDMMLGKFGAYGTQYRGDEAALVARPGDKLPELLDQAIRKLPEGSMPEPGTIAQEIVTVPSTVQDAIVGSMFLAPDSTIYERRPDSLGEARAEVREFASAKEKDRVAGMIRIRDAFAKLRRSQISESADDDLIASQRKQLNKFYDAFAKKHGPINQTANRRLFGDDPTWPQISALEDKFDKGISEAVAKTTGEVARPPSAHKAPIFTKRTQQPYRRPTTATSAKDALSTVLADRGRVDLEAISRLYGKPESVIIDELGNLLFKTPAGAYETADDYLSGNVKQKLAEAKRAVENDPDMRRNVAALSDVIPADIEPVDIDVKPGSPWIPANHIADFATHVLQAKGTKAFFSKANARWAIDLPNPDPAAQIQWGTDHASVKEVLTATLNGTTITIRDKMSDGTSVLNQPATDAANEKIERVKVEWNRWIWEEEARRDQLARLYNDTFNTDVLRQFDGRHLTLPGKVDFVKFRPHQNNFVWRALQSSTTLADHVVGAGKTFMIIATIMEMRRIGQAKKPMIVVPNHLVGQWAADFIRLYPGAKVLAATKKDFDAANRKRLFARVATGDWDAVIVAHSSFGRIGVDPEFEKQFIDQQISDLETSIGELRAMTGEKSRNVSQLTKWRDGLRAKLTALIDSDRKDEGLTFDEMGVDALAVDEAHEFKNLQFATSMQRVAGLGSQGGSQKAQDLHLKVQSVKSRTGGRNIIFATGTPISNTMAEMFTMQRYLDGDGLRNLGVSHFDAWARVFGEIVTDWELAPAGTYKLKSRFAKFVNIPELMLRYRSFADVITNDDIKAMMAAIGETMPLPKVKGGKPQNVVVPRSADQGRYIGEGKADENGELQYPRGSLVQRAENLPKKPGKGDDNMLKVMSDARKAALDMRLIDPSYPDTPGSKVHIAADNIVRIYRAKQSDLGTQLVFIDLSTPKKARAREEAAIRDLIKKAEEGDEAAQEKLDKMSPDEFDALTSQFSVYDDLRTKLVDRGMPDTAIAFIHDANTDLQKTELFGKVNSGRIRVLLGSTAKMGAGTNVQQRLVALHHLDAPWRPSDLEQRDGRGIRQGNELYMADPDGFEIEIARYATEKTLDARMWQTIEGKAKFIAQVRKGGNDRVVEDIGGEAMNSAEMKAAASGNPIILEEMDLRSKVKKLQGRGSEHAREQHRITAKLRELAAEKERIEKRLPMLEADAATATEAAAADFTAIIQGATVDKPTAMGEAILKAAEIAVADNIAVVALGTFAGFKLSLAHNYGRNFNVLLDGAMPHYVAKLDSEGDSPLGIAMRIVNTVRKTLPGNPAEARTRIEEIDKQAPALRKQIGAWPDAADLDAAKARHAEVLSLLRPKPKAPAAATPASEAAPDADLSIAPERKPVAKLAGTELGVAFKGPEDMPVLRQAAVRWYDQNLRNTTATMQDGAVVNFSRKGMGKSTSNAKGDKLLRAVPAIKAIIESGTVLSREPGNRAGVVERIIIGARVTLGDEPLDLAVSVHKTATGRYHYDLTFDRDMSGAAEPGVNSGGPAPEDGPLPSLEVPQRAPDDLNLVEWAPESKAPAGWDVTGEAEEHVVTEADKQEIRDIVKEVAGLDDVQFVRRIGLPKGARGWGSTAPTTAAGLYDPATDAILISLDSARRHVAYHEAFHRLQRLFMTDRDRAILEAEVGRLRRIVRTIPGREEQAATMVGKELEAEAFGLYSTTADLTVKPHVAIRAVWDRLAAMIRRVRNYLEGRGFSTAEDVFERARAGEMKNRPQERFTGNISRTSGAARQPIEVSYSIAPMKRGEKLTQNRIVEELRGRLTDLQPSVLAAIPLNYFTELAQPNMTAVGEYLRVKRIMDAYRGKKHSDMDAVAQDWLKFARLGKDKAVALATLMHDATLAGVDPVNTDQETRALPGYDELRRRFTAMAPAARALFVEVRDAYKAQADELDAILLDNVRKAQEIGQRRAEARYNEQLERINEAKLSPSAKRDAIEDAEKAFKTERMKAGWSMKARLTKMRIAFEASRVASPYFPLARFGRYFATVRDVDGTLLSFSKRERAADRDRLAEDMRREYPTAKVDVGVLESGAEVRSAMDPRVVAEIEEILGGAGVDSTVMDMIWQRYLESMPDLSTRKRFIHRKGVAGFDADALRTFSSHMFHAAHQMGRLKYGMELQELTNEVSDQAKEAKDTTRAMTLSNELRKRHKWVMTPTGGAVAQMMTSAAFVWYLAASPASAVINMAQTPMLGIPILAGRFGSLTKAAAAIGKASKDTVAGRGSMQGANLTAEERHALDAFYESGLIDRTQSHDIAGVGETGVEYSPLRARVMAAMSWMFHRAEVWNREVTAIAAYRMAKASGQNHSDAIDSAHDLTWKTHFDYSNSSRPRLLQNDFAKVALVFRAHNINMLYRVFRDIHQSFKGATPQARKEARYQLAGIVGMMSLMAGVTGTIGFNVALAIAGMVFGDDDDPMEFKQQFKADVLDILGPELGGIVLNGLPGHYLGIDLTNRLGMPDLWFRSPYKDLEGREEFEYWVLNSLGASVSMVGGMVQGVSLLAEGNTERGIEALVPKWARDLMKSYRMMNEGVTNLKGDVIMEADDVAGWDAIAQAIGFTPAAVAESYERNSALKDAESRINDRRRELVNAFALATLTQDKEARADALTAIKRFNTVPFNKAIAITPDTLRQSLAVRKRNAAKRQDGVLIQNERLGRQLRDALPEPIYR